MRAIPLIAFFIVDKTLFSPHPHEPKCKGWSSMGLIVQKFGGTSVGSAEKFKMPQIAPLLKSKKAMMS